jgi:dephospho-CoA kinase
MMGSGKTTVGRILSEALGYCFVDRLVIFTISVRFILEDGSHVIWWIMKQHKHGITIHFVRYAIRFPIFHEGNLQWVLWADSC